MACLALCDFLWDADGGSADDGALAFGGLVGYWCQRSWCRYWRVLRVRHPVFDGEPDPIDFAVAMVAIHPFRALRYVPDAVGDLSKVLAPPYDVIRPEMQAQLYEASPYNVVRLILAQDEATDNEADNRYTRAARDYNTWLKEGILRRDPVASFTVIEHAFKSDEKNERRLGFLGLLSLEAETNKKVIRHEATMAKPKADRQRLLDAVPANLSPIFCVYPDAKREAQGLLEAFVRAHPETAKVNVSEDDIRIWIVNDSTLISKLQEILAEGTLLIADGHHRYEVARANRDRSHAVMTYLVSMQDPGLKVRPIHRLVHPSASLNLKELEVLCGITIVDERRALEAWLEEGNGARFGCYAQGKLYKVAVLPKQMARWRLFPPVARPLAELDVSLLHHLIFPAMKIDADQITYVADTMRALAAVDAKQADSAWLLRGIPMEQVQAVASHGVTLEAKSTFFYPKVLSGIAFNPFDEARSAIKNASTP